MTDPNKQPERVARETIDAALDQAGWVVQSRDEMNVAAGLGVAIREFKTDAGFADYLLYVDKKPAGVIEAKKVGTTLTGVEARAQSTCAAAERKHVCHEGLGHHPQRGPTTTMTARRWSPARIARATSRISAWRSSSTGTHSTLRVPPRTRSCATTRVFVFMASGALVLSCSSPIDSGESGSTTDDSTATTSASASLTGSTSESTDGMSSEGGSSSGSGSTGRVSGSSSGGSEPSPEEVCRASAPPCPQPEAIGLEAGLGCSGVDIYIFESLDECNVPFETRCEVMDGTSTGASNHCGATMDTREHSRYVEGWFREVDEGLEFWGSGESNPPLEPGLTRCFDDPEVCHCECPDIQP